MNEKEQLARVYAEALLAFTQAVKDMKAALDGNDPAEDQTNPIVLGSAKRVLRARVALFRAAADLQEWSLDNEDVPSGDVPDFLPDTF